MISSNKEIDPLDATKLDLNSPEICKFMFIFNCLEKDEDQRYVMIPHFVTTADCK